MGPEEKSSSRFTCPREDSPDAEYMTLIPPTYDIVKRVIWPVSHWLSEKAGGSPGALARYKKPGPRFSSDGGRAGEMHHREFIHPNPDPLARGGEEAGCIPHIYLNPPRPTWIDVPRGTCHVGRCGFRTHTRERITLTHVDRWPARDLPCWSTCGFYAYTQKRKHLDPHGPTAREGLHVGQSVFRNGL